MVVDLSRLALALVLTGTLSSCVVRGGHHEAEAEAGRVVSLDGGTHFTLPASYHEVTAASGRTFRLRGGARPSYSTVHVQRRASGELLGLDETFSLLMADLGRQEGFDLTSLELHFAGDALCLVYSVRFTLLDVPRRQWGALVDGRDGITAILMTAPTDGFADVSLDFAGVLASLDHAERAPQGTAHAP